MAGEQTPGRVESSHDVLDRLVAEYVERRRLGEDVSIEEYVSAYPNLAEDLRGYCSTAEFLDRAARGPETEEATPAPERIGRYRVESELGRGGQAIVYKAQDATLGRPVALKVWKGPRGFSGGGLARFKREAEATSRVEHSGICAVYEAGIEDGLPFIAMRYVEGVTLAQRIADARARQPASSGVLATIPRRQSSKRSPYPEFEETAHIVEQAARALHAAHEKGLIHRDIKPSNIMVTPQGDPVLLDFGLVQDERAGSALLTTSGDILGTPAYMAPEQIDRGQPMDRRTDVYSLGATLYECLTLRRPFDAATVQQMFLEILGAPVPDPRRFRPDLPRDLRVVLETALEKDPERRYESASAFADDLRRIRKSEPIHARPAGLFLRLQRWGQRSPGLATALVSIFLLITTALAITLLLLGELRGSLTETSALALAGASVEARRSDAALGLLLALEAVRSNETPETLSQLQEALAASHERMVFEGHEGWVRSAHFSPSRDAVLSASDDGSARLWSLDGELLRSFEGHNGRVYSAVFSPDGETILTAEGWTRGGEGGAARLFSRSTGEQLAVLSHEQPLSRRVSLPVGSESGGELAVFSHQGANILTGALDGKAKLWDRAGNLLLTIPHESWLAWVAFSPDDRLLLTAEGNGTVSLFDRDGAVHARLTGHTSSVLCARFSPDGNLLVTTGRDATARLWAIDAEPPRELARLEHDASVFGARFSPTGDALITWGQDKKVRVWSVDGVLQGTMSGAQGVVLDALFSPDGELVLACSHEGRARLYRRSTEQVVEFNGHNSSILSVEFSGDGRHVLTASRDRTVRLSTWNPRELPFLLGHSGPSPAVRGGGFFPDGERFITAAGGSAYLWGRDGSKLREYPSGGSLTSAAILPDGRVLTGDQFQAGLRVWTQDGELQEFLPTVTLVNGFAISTTGDRVVTIENDGHARLWAFGPGEWSEVGAFPHGQNVRRVAFSPTGARFLVGTQQGRVVLWDLEGNRHLDRTLGGTIGAVAFSPSGSELLIGADGGTLRLLDLAGEPLVDFAGHHGVVESVAFSSSGSRVISCSSQDETVRVWNLDGSERMRLRGEPFRSVTYSPDAARILTTSLNGTARFWPAEAPELIELSEQRLAGSRRAFSAAELARYRSLLEPESPKKTRFP